MYRDSSKVPSNLERQYQDEWIQGQLDSFPIEEGVIEGIGQERRRVLASFGIETAADIGGHIAYQVPGFGGVLTSRLMTWREERIRSLKRLGIPPMPRSYVQRVHNAQLTKVLAEAKRGKALAESISGLRGTADVKLASLASAIDASRALVREMRRQASSSA
jgi:DNA-binding helix-hairpin-helix protein with protein kinase domain